MGGVVWEVLLSVVWYRRDLARVTLPSSETLTRCMQTLSTSSSKLIADLVALLVPGLVALLYQVQWHCWCQV